jgi:hypothetical protein
MSGRSGTHRRLLSSVRNMPERLLPSISAQKPTVGGPFVRCFALIPEGLAQRAAKLRHHDVQALDGRTFRLRGL